MPTKKGIHRENCSKDISHCPAGYPKDFSTYCEKGPVDMICIHNESYPCKNGSYRNSFCEFCWKDKLLEDHDKEEGHNIGKYLYTTLLITSIASKSPSLTGTILF